MQNLLGGSSPRHPGSPFAVWRRRGMTTRLPLKPEALETFCRRHEVRKLSLFGSVLKGTARPDSDIDLLVEFEPRGSTHAARSCGNGRGARAAARWPARRSAHANRAVKGLCAVCCPLGRMRQAD